MKFSAATVLAAVAGAQAYAYSNVTYTTEVVTAVTTYCPGPTQITYGGETYTISEATTLTITNCAGGCTVSYPVHTISAPGYTNATAPVAYPTGSVSTPAAAAPTYPVEEAPVTAGAGKAVAISGAALAGVLGFAALL